MPTQLFINIWDSVSNDWQNFIITDNFLNLGWWVIRLDIGVKVFFSLSGFILSIPFLNFYFFNGTKISLRQYFWRRLIRLEPPFILSFLFFYFIHIVFLNESIASLMPNFLAGLIYSHGFIFGYNNPINPVTWSLEVEAQFYLLLPFLFLLLNLLKSNYLRFIVITLFFIISVWLKSFIYYNDLFFFNKSIFSFFTNFISGGFFAFLFLKYKFYFKNKNLLYDLIGFISIFFMFYFYKPQAHYISNIMLNLSVIILFISVFKGLIFNWFFTRKFIYLIGGMCYSIYLLHFAWFKFIIRYSINIFSHNQYWISLLFQLIIMLTTAILISSLFYILVEKPFMDKNWPKKIKNFRLKIKN